MFTILSQWPRVHILKANKHMSIITDGLKCRQLTHTICESICQWLPTRSNLWKSFLVHLPQELRTYAGTSVVICHLGLSQKATGPRETCILKPCDVGGFKNFEPTTTITRPGINLTLQFHMLHVWNMYQQPKKSASIQFCRYTSTMEHPGATGAMFRHAWTTTGAPESIAAGTRRRRHGDHTSVQQWCLERWAVNGILHILGYFLVGENWISWLTDFVADAIIYTVWDNDPSLYSWPRESGLDHKIDWITAMKPLALVGHIECLGTFSKWVICRDERMTVQIDAYCQCWIHRVHRDTEI